MGWTATVLIPHEVRLYARTQAEADSAAKAFAAGVEKMNGHGAKLLQVVRDNRPNPIPDDLPPPPLAA